MEAWKLELYYGTPELYHYGTKGMHWGTRHWQNPDGTFNEAGKQRYFSNGGGENYRPVKPRSDGNSANRSVGSGNKSSKERKQLTSEQKKRIVKIAVGALATAAVVGGTVYLAKTGKLDGVVGKGKNAVEKGLEPIRLKRIDPHGFIDSNALKSTISNADSSARSMWEKTSGNLGKNYVDRQMIGSKTSTNKAYSKLIKDLSDKEIASINNGEKTLRDFYIDRLDKGFYSSKSVTNNVSNLVGKVKDAAVNGKNSINSVEKSIVEEFKQASSGIKNAAKVASNNATKAAVSGTNIAKKAVKTGVNNTKKAIKSTAKSASSEAGDTLLKYAGQKIMNGTKKSRQQVQRQKQQQYVKQYKHEHPGTKLSDEQILQNYGGY